jgi:hypothetical protein
MKQKLTTMAILAVLAIGIVLVLWKLSDAPNKDNNGFIRNYKSSLVKTQESMIDTDVKYIAGINTSTIYFSTLTPGELAWTASNTIQLKRKPVSSSQSFSKSSLLSISYPQATVLDANYRQITLINLHTGIHSHRNITELFSRAIPISPTTFILRKFKPGIRDQCLYRYDYIKDSIYNEKRVTPFSNDGGLISEGLLSYDAKQHLCSYVSYYSNKSTILDTNLNIIKEGHTIDTFSHYQGAIQIIDNNSITNDGPMKIVNRCTSADDGLLYVCSSMKADNESLNVFNKSCSIDVYNGRNINYLYSYRLLEESGGKIRDFIVKDGWLYVLFKGKIVIYQLLTTLK